MAVKFNWDDHEKTVLLYTLEAGWNWNDLHKNLARSTLWFDQAEQPIDRVIDLRGTQLPGGAVGHLRSLGKKQHRNETERVVIIGVPDSVVQLVTAGHPDREYRTGTRIVRFADTLEEARAIIAQWRAAPAH